MITYVNTVLVGAGVATAAPTATSLNGASTDAGKFIIVDNNGDVVSESTAVNAEKIRIGIVTNKNTVKVNYKSGAISYSPIIKWSNVINKADIKSYTKHKNNGDTPESVTIDLIDVADATIQNKRIVVRLTFKDLPTRYRKWTESYEIVTSANETNETLAIKIANKINKEYKRARISAVANSTSVVLTALPYDDDNSEDSISPANTVRFSCNMWYTDPKAEGFDSKNKYSVNGAVITKTEGKVDACSAKLVRDLESAAMGYQGILNRGECTWPIIKPEMQTKLKDVNGNPMRYNGITLEFENMYRTADDLHRRTKQTVNMFTTDAVEGSSVGTLTKILDAFVKGEHSNVIFGTSDAEIK